MLFTLAGRGGGCGVALLERELEPGGGLGAVGWERDGGEGSVVGVASAMGAAARASHGRGECVAAAALVRVGCAWAAAGACRFPLWLAGRVGVDVSARARVDDSRCRVGWLILVCGGGGWRGGCLTTVRGVGGGD